MMTPKGRSKAKKKWVPGLSNKPVDRFIPCDEDSQTFNWQQTNKRARYINMDTLRKRQQEGKYNSPLDFKPKAR